jgi:hypothetical protein
MWMAASSWTVCVDEVSRNRTDLESCMSTEIPGRRISYGETFFTDWGNRGGDCALVRAQMLIKSTASGSIRISVETRSAEDTASTEMETSFPSSDPRLLSLESVGVKTAIYTATEDADIAHPRGFQEQYRFKVQFYGGSAGDYCVLRLLPPVFFDNAYVVS